jgi:hypothetical protein
VQTQINAQIPKSTVTAKGDLLVATGSGTVVAQAVGTNGTVLTANSAQADGVEWAALPSSFPASASATVATSQSTTSTTYTDLATAGPSVTLTTGTKALVIVTSYVNASGTFNSAFVGFAVSGATTIASADATALNINVDNSMGIRIRASMASLVTLTAGSNTFTLKYKITNSGTNATFADRNIFVMNLA